jgi:hypothetical protein
MLIKIDPIEVRVQVVLVIHRLIELTEDGLCDAEQNCW